MMQVLCAMCVTNSTSVDSSGNTSTEIVTPTHAGLGEIEKNRTISFSSNRRAKNKSFIDGDGC